MFDCCLSAEGGPDALVRMPVSLTSEATLLRIIDSLSYLAGKVPLRNLLSKLKLSIKLLGNDATGNIEIIGDSIAPLIHDCVD